MDKNRMRKIWVLYQGTTLVVPKASHIFRALAPGALIFPASWLRKKKEDTWNPSLI